jgi:hypothetical protein
MDAEIAQAWPRTIKKGVLKGRTFESQSEYARALAETKTERDKLPREVEGEERKIRGKKSYAQEIATVVEGINVLLSALPQTQPDALNEREAELLTFGLDKWQQSDPKYAKLFKRASKVGGWGALVFAGIMIALPRLQRRGMLPGGAAERLAEVVERYGVTPEAARQAYGQNGNSSADTMMWANSRPVPPVYSGVSE